MTPPNWRNRTQTLIWLVLAVVCIWDALAKSFGGMGSTVSSLMFDLGYDWPVIPLMTGIVIGHFFFSMWGRESKRVRDAILAGATDEQLAKLVRENFGGT